MRYRKALLLPLGRAHPRPGIQALEPIDVPGRRTAGAAIRRRVAADAGAGNRGRSTPTLNRISALS